LSTEQHKALVRRFVDEVLNANNLDALGEVCSADCISHSLPPDWPQGVEALKEIMRSGYRVLPDLHYTIEDLIAEGDKVAVRFTRRGTHRGEFMGSAPSGRAVQWTGIDIFRIADGKLVENWSNFDQLGMMQQLGAIPAPSQAG